jgi:hypothetical protein
MADSGERRMVFDTRGRRRNVIRVVYAILALLMGASLFVAVGPFNLAELFSNSSSSSASEALDEQAERIEGRLANDPTNEQLLLSLTRAQIGAGNANLEAESGAIPTAAREDFNAGLQTWSRYVRLTDEPNPTAAQLVAQTAFTMSERGSNTVSEIRSNVDKALAAQEIAAKEQPSLGSLSSLAIYQYFNGDLAAGDKSAEEAMALAPKAEAKNIEKQLTEIRKRGARFAKQIEQIAKEQAKVGRSQLKTPFEGLGPPGATVGE